MSQLLDDFVDCFFRLGDTELKKLENIFTAPEEKLIPSLVEAYELEEILPYVRKTPAFFKNGLANATDWADKRGLLISLKTAVKWLGFTDYKFVSNSPGPRWSQYCLIVDAKLTEEDVAKIKGVLLLSEPARSKLTRISSKKKNIKKMGLSSKNSVFGKNRLSNDSGIYDKDKVLISI